MMKYDIERLKNDEEYYGEYGKQFLSASDVKNLLNDPMSFKKSESTLDMLKGSYFHALLIQPEKLESFPVLDVKNRNSKAYQEAKAKVPDGLILLQSEVEELVTIANRIKSNEKLYDLIYDDNCEYEVPGFIVWDMIENVFKKLEDCLDENGELDTSRYNIWKGKCDILHPDYVIDLKSTANAQTFRKSARDYYYDSQAFVYEAIFDKPVYFIVACKKTMQPALLTAGTMFLARGEERVVEANEVYHKYYREGATDSVEDYIIEYEL
jgi:hypothetical protein